MNNLYDFLFIHYEQADFIINRSEFFGSVMYKKVSDIETPYRFFREVIQYGPHCVLSFDINSWLENYFQAGEETVPAISIIASVSQFSKRAKKKIQSTLLKNRKDCSADLLAFTISGKSEIKKYNARNFRLFSDFYQRHLQKKGIWACGFTENKIQYLIDMEAAVESSIENDKRRRSG